MDLKKIDAGGAGSPFKAVQGRRGVKFRQQPRSGATDAVLELEHNGHDRVVVTVRERPRLASGRLATQHNRLLAFDSEEAVQLASILLYLVEEHLRDDAEAPFHHYVTTPERAAFGSNWLLEEQDTAAERLERRRSRSHVLGLMRRCLEVCEDEAFIRELCMNLALWADRSGDGFAARKAEQALYQLDMVPDEAGSPAGAEN